MGFLDYTIATTSKREREMGLWDIATTIASVVVQGILDYTIHELHRSEGSSVHLDLDEHLRRQPSHHVADSNAQVVVQGILDYTIHDLHRSEGSSVHLDLDEHLRSHHVADSNAQEVAFVKMKGFGEQWYRITYTGSCLAVQTVSTVSMGWKKRFGAATGMKTAWVRLQTGEPPLLATEKGKWNKVPLAQASRSGSWLELNRLLGTFSPSHDNEEQAFVAMPVVVLFALLSTAASCNKTLSLKLQPIGGFTCTMKLGNTPEHMVKDFSRDLNEGVVFVVRSSWRFAALLDAFGQSDD